MKLLGFFLVLPLCFASDAWTQNKTFRVGIYQNEPKIFRDESGAPKGFYPEILSAITKMNGWELTYVPCSWNECLDRLEEDKIDILPDVAQSPERERRFDFGHETALHSWSYLYSRNGGVMRTWKDLDQRSVAVLNNSQQHEELLRMAAELRIAPRVVPCPSFRAVFEAVADGRVDIGIVNRFFGERFEQDYDLQRLPMPPFMPVPLFFAVASPLDKSVVRELDASLATLKANPNSPYYQALRRWFAPPSRQRLPEWAYWTMGGLLFVLLATTAFIVVRNRRLLALEKEKADKRIRSAFENVTTGNIVFDANGVIHLFNSVAEKIFGHPAEEVIGRNLSMLFPKPDWLGLDKFIRRFLASGDIAATNQRRETTGLRKNGGTFPMKVGVAELSVDDEVCYVASVHDLSQVRSLEAQLRQAQKMEVVGQLTGGLAHDINNALGIILMNIGLMSKSKDINPLVDKYSSVAAKAVRRASALTRKLLDFSRTEIHKTERVSVNEFVADIKRLIEKSLTPAITLEMTLDEGVWMVDIDPDDFEDSILNLVINAQDAMPNGGTLVIETANKVIDEHYARLNPGSSVGEYVMISVSDTGVGMPREVVERAFEPFYTTKGAGKGTGLGLSMVYGFVQRSGGHIKIYSEPGAGTAVHLYLPRARGELEAVTTDVAAEGDIPRGNETILAVDDEEDLLDSAVSILSSLGYTTLAATSGNEAFEILEKNPSINLLFCDIIMPGGMDGYQLAMKALESRPGLKVLLTSGFTAKREAFKGDERKTVAELAKTLLHKPYNIAELANAVRRALDA